MRLTENTSRAIIGPPRTVFFNFACSGSYFRVRSWRGGGTRCSHILRFANASSLIFFVFSAVSCIFHSVSQERVQPDGFWATSCTQRGSWVENDFVHKFSVNWASSKAKRKDVVSTLKFLFFCQSWHVSFLPYKCCRCSRGMPGYFYISENEEHISISPTYNVDHCRYNTPLGMPPCLALLLAAFLKTLEFSEFLEFGGTVMNRNFLAFCQWLLKGVLHALNASLVK